MYEEDKEDEERMENEENGQGEKGSLVATAPVVIVVIGELWQW